MRRRVPLLFVALAALLLALSSASIAHQGHEGGRSSPPHDAALAVNGPVGFWTWTSPSANDSSRDTFEPGAEGAVQVAWRDQPGGGNATYNATVAVDAPANVSLTGPVTFETGNVTGTDEGGALHLADPLPFALDEFEGERTVTVNVTVYEANTTQRNTTGNTTQKVTTWERVDGASLSYRITVKAPPAAPPEGPPWLLVAGLVAAGGAAVAGGAYVYRRRQGPTAPRRSKALQELEAEDDEEVQEQRQEQRQEERKSRELRILEAKADDHREGIERARKRLEEGEITEHQFERIKERKEDALEDVLEKIEEKKQDLE